MRLASAALLFLATTCPVTTCLVTTAAAQPALIPAPASASFPDAPGFVVTSRTPIVAPPGDAEAIRTAQMLADLIGPGVGVTHPDSLDVQPRVEPGGSGSGAISFMRAGDGTLYGEEGYVLTVTEYGIQIEAATGAGLFYGMQTLRQLMPPEVEQGAARLDAAVVPAARIVDRPRYEWRGAMLDVARHFFEVETVERYVDLLALYKMNRLHLHLSDDQGWRIEIPGWPRLTSVGAASEVGGGPGGFYTLQDYDRLVRYAAERYVTIVPEIDMPGHIHAAQVAYPSLACDGQPREHYTGIRVGFSALCVENEETYRFVDDVVRTLAERTPGDYFHLGGDEVKTLSPEQFASFIQRAAQIVDGYGKRVVAWDEAAPVAVQPGPVLQLWRPFLHDLQSGDEARRKRAEAQAAVLQEAASRGASFILSPADRIYLDIKYDSTTALGLNWAGYNGVRDAYDWGELPWLETLPPGSVLGLEAPLWTETIASEADLFAMVLPRLPGVAERGWSPERALVWDDYRPRLAVHAGRWQIIGYGYARSPEVWR
jgi:hexosaminidase